MFDFDIVLITAINGLAGQNFTLDSFAVLIRSNPMIKALPLILILSYFWFRRKGDQASTRAKVLATFVLSVTSLFVGRVLAVLLPFRLRPLHQDDVAINMAIGLPEQTLSKWSSMPSDHAILYTTLATCIFCIHKGYGLLALLHVTILVLLPRVFLGLHWPTDILVGAAVGALMTIALMPWLSRIFEARQTAHRAETNPGLFYPIAFFLSFQLTTNFDSLRAFLSGMKDIVLG